jgi:hypothetical protein
MKKVFLILVAGAFALSSCGGNEETVAEKRACDANDLESAVTCLCELYEQYDNSDDLSDDEFYALDDKINKFNVEIDGAIAAGKYTSDDMYDLADKLDCNL